MSFRLGTCFSGALQRVPRWIPFAGVACVLVLLAPRGAAQTPPVSGAATEHPLATRAALDTLAKGGNAVDAVIAAALVSGVVNPSSSGIGGGGFVLVYKPGDTQPVLLDFRETAPRLLDPVSFESADAPGARGELVGVPGEVAGLFEASRRFGKLPWKELVAPAERRASSGFHTGTHLARTLAGQTGEELRKDAELRAVYFPAGRALTAGTLVRNPKLAKTLRRVAAEGPSALYDGPIAADIVAAAQSARGRLSLADLRDYRVKERAPLRAEWAGHTVFTTPPPSAGGLLLLQTLGMLSAEELRRLGYGSGPYLHLISEAFRATLADRITRVGDPDIIDVDVPKLLDPAYLKRRRSELSIDRTHTLPLYITREQGTHHMSVMDATGMTVALTTTVNRTFGAKVVAKDSGVVLNDQLADFTLPSDVAAFGVRNGPNSPRPLARPVSSMTPTIAVKDGKAVLSIGGSGGTTIPTNVAQLFIARLLFGKPPEELVKSPRFYVFQRGPTLLLEPSAPQALLDDLAYRGERLGTMRFSSHAVQMVTRDATGVRAAADPRKFGSAETR